MTALEKLREALQEHDCDPRGSNLSFRAKCPGHGGGVGSLIVSQGKSGVILHCFAACPVEDVLAAVYLHTSDLFDVHEQGYQPPRRPADPLAEFTTSERQFLRGLDILRLRDQMAAEPRSPAVPWQVRLAAAEQGERVDADRHAWRTYARWAALACDDRYVRAARAANRKTPEQVAVLVTYAEDLEW